MIFQDFEKDDYIINISTGVFLIKLLYAIYLTLHICKWIFIIYDDNIKRFLIAIKDNC